MSKNFNILIDNSDKDLSRYLEYFDENFENFDSAMFALFKLADGKALIRTALVSLGEDWMCSIDFDEKNCIKEISPPSDYFFALNQILPLLKKEWKHKVSSNGLKIYKECECEEV